MFVVKIIYYLITVTCIRIVSRYQCYEYFGSILFILLLCNTYTNTIYLYICAVYFIRILLEYIWHFQLGGDFAETLLKFSDYGLDLNKTHFVGHSLGAHVMGVAGNKMMEKGVPLPW